MANQEKIVGEIWEMLQDYFGDNLIWVLSASAILLLFIFFEIADRIADKKAKKDEAVQQSERAEADCSKSDEAERIVAIVAKPVKLIEFEAAESSSDTLIEEINTVILPETERSVKEIKSAAVSEKADGMDKKQQKPDGSIENQQQEADGNSENQQNEKPEKRMFSEDGSICEIGAEKPVQININIERGIVKIEKSEAGITCRVLDCAEDAQTTETESEKQSEAVETGEEVVLEKINIIRTVPAKKFGPDNMNTGRSGRVFTEEELKMQIK